MNQSLPANFLWGNSVSSMQTEGAWNEGGKGMSVYDIREAGENISDWKVATDSYHRYREDFDLMQDLGMNCYRFQISRAASARRVTAILTTRVSPFTTALSTI